MGHFIRHAAPSLFFLTLTLLPQAGGGLRAAPAPLARQDRHPRPAAGAYDLTYGGVRWTMWLHPGGRYETAPAGSSSVDYVGVWWLDGGYLYVAERAAGDRRPSHLYCRQWVVWMPAAGGSYDGVGSANFEGNGWENVTVKLRRR